MKTQTFLAQFTVFFCAKNQLFAKHQKIDTVKILVPSFMYQRIFFAESRQILLVF